MKYLILLLLSTLTFQANSQYNVDWGKMIGVRLTKSFMDTDSNIYLAGGFDNSVDFDPGPGSATISTIGGYDFFVVKLNKKGIYQWVRTFGTDSCTICHDRAFDIAVDGKGNVILTGDFFGPLDFDPDPSNTFIMKSGGGMTTDFLLKLDSLGDFIWAKKFDNNIASSGNGKVSINGNDEIYYITSFMDSIDADPSISTLYFTTQSVGTDNTLITKLKSSGVLIWAKSLKGTYNTVDQFISTNTNTLLLTGKYRGSVDFDIRNTTTNTLNSGTATHSYLLKITSDTIFGYVKDFTTTGNGLDTKDIFSSSDSSLFLCGNFKGTVDFDPGTTTNSKTSVVSTGDAFILKLDAFGDYEELFTFGGAGINKNYCKTIKEDYQGNLYFGGEYMGTVDFDKGAGTSNHTSVGSLDAFVLKTDDNLDYISSFSIGGNQWEMLESIYVDSNHLFLLGTSASSTGDFDPSSATFPIQIPVGSVLGNFTLKMNKLGGPTVSIDDLSKSKFKLYPNPVNYELNIKGINKNSIIQIISSKGEVVYLRKNLMEEDVINVSKLAKGVYSIVIINANSKENVMVKKFIKL